MSRSWRKGSTPAWRRVRALVLARDGHVCQIRIEGVCTTAATCVHHTVGRAVSGDDPAHLVAACAPCNARVSDPARVSDHQRVVFWARANQPTTARALARQFPHITPDNLHVILTRARRRRELVRAGQGIYRAGPVGLPSSTGPPPHRVVTKW